LKVILREREKEIWREKGEGEGGRESVGVMDRERRGE